MLEQERDLRWKHHEDHYYGGSDEKRDLDTIASVSNKCRKDNNTHTGSNQRTPTVGEKQCGQYYEHFGEVEDFFQKGFAFDKESKRNKDHHPEKDATEVGLYEERSDTSDIGSHVQIIV